MSRRGINEDADVIVVGAGPAGSTAATYLARAGLDVLLLTADGRSAWLTGAGASPEGDRPFLDRVDLAGLRFGEAATVAARHAPAARDADAGILEGGEERGREKVAKEERREEQEGFARLHKLQNQGGK